MFDAAFGKAMRHAWEASGRDELDRMSLNMGLFGNNNQNQQSLMPSGLSNGQQQMLGNMAGAAQASGLTAMTVGQRWGKLTK